MNYYKLILFFVVLIIFGSNANATHNRSGEITYDQIGPLTIRATITTYTKATSTSADRDTLLMNWGDGSSEMVPRSNTPGEIIQGEDIKINTYIAEHTYPGRATFTMSFEDPNRVNNIVNVNFPNSVDVPFFVSTTFTLINTQFNGFNNSVKLLQPPIDFACANKRFIHNPNAYDVDGDSLSYELIVPLQSENTEVPSYKYPDEVSPGPNNTISLDPETGDFVWDSPKQVGEYNIAIKINEYRNGVLLNSVIRDMQIRVAACQSDPPTIESIEEICVIAGETINIPITVDDIDQIDLVKISGTGGPFQQEFSPSELTQDNEFLSTAINANFIWKTQCEHIAKTFYQVVIKAQDNSINGESGLTILKTIKIKVSGPPPLNLSSEIQDGNNRLEWESPYNCEITENNYFLGFNVWRKTNSNQFELDTCQGGLEGKGYEIIEFLTSTQENNKYFFIDDELEKGQTYCYRILGLFALKTSSGNPFNIVESLASEEVCIQLKQDIPLLTEVSVLNTDSNSGIINVSWIKPILSDFDTIEFPGPYQYNVLRSSDGTDFEMVNGASFSSASFLENIELSFEDNVLNTLTTQYHYIIDFYSAGIYYSSSPPSSSVFLNTLSTDQKIELNWKHTTSWQNYNFTIYRKNLGGNNFEKIAETEELNFIDTNLENNLEYCYLIESEGTYGLRNTPSPLFNLSQENCGIPIDTVGPCFPEFMVSNPCTENANGVTVETQVNALSWNMSNLICDDSNDIEGYIIYYAPNLTSELEIIAEVNSNRNFFEHLPSEGINGCYKISAIDTLGNEGPLSDFVCVNNCPTYILPNTYTPNNDGSNDFFVPIENRFVTAVDFHVFTRWGNKVFETDDPELNWNGISNNGTELDQGSYYYTCRIFDSTNEGELKEVDYISGFIQLLR